jgi:hypothetical protein
MQDALGKVPLAAVTPKKRSPRCRVKWTRAGVLQPEVERPETEVECEKRQTPSACQTGSCGSM